MSFLISLIVLAGYCLGLTYALVYIICLLLSWGLFDWAIYKCLLFLCITREELDLAQQQYIESLEKYENNHLGNFRRIYPGIGSEKYEKFFHSSGTLFQETAAFKARSELAR